MRHGTHPAFGGPHQQAPVIAPPCALRSLDTVWRCHLACCTCSQHGPLAARLHPPHTPRRNPFHQSVATRMPRNPAAHAGTVNATDCACSRQLDNGSCGKLPGCVLNRRYARKAGSPSSEAWLRMPAILSGDLLPPWRCRALSPGVQGVSRDWILHHVRRRQCHRSPPSPLHGSTCECSPAERTVVAARQALHVPGRSSMVFASRKPAS